MNRFFALVLIIILAACKEEITPLVPPNSTGNGNTIPPSEPVSGKYANCLSVLSNSTLDVVTWNIEFFPKDGANTLALMKEMITTMDADIIAVQEITSTTNFNLLMDELAEYDGVVAPGSGQRIGFIYKTSEITSFQPIVELFTDDAAAFPRPALKTTITHVSGEVVTLINVHLKCCDDYSATYGYAIDRRKAAAAKIKNYIDQNLTNASVIVLGDYNEDITEPEGNGVFTTLINDATNYKFADMAIASGNSTNFSYQSSGYTSHLDHILITNELFDNLGEVRTIKFSACESQYIDKVSDHFPVMMRLQDLN